VTANDALPAKPRREIRVVIVDDHSLFRQGITAGIGAHVDLVGEADDVGSAIDLIVAEAPDVALLDVHLPSGLGGDVITGVAERTQSSPTRYLGLSVSDAPQDVLGLVRAGARGYVVKRIDSIDLVDAIAQVAEGNAVFSPKLAGFVLDAFATNPDRSAQDSRTDDAVEDTINDHTSGATDGSNSSDIDLLTPREREVMQHLARGYTYKEIGTELHISARTVETHASAVLRKLQLSNRHELTHWAARNRLL